MHCTVPEAQARVGPIQFLHWITYKIQEAEAALQDFDRLDWQIAGLAWHVANLRHTVLHFGAKEIPVFDVDIQKFLIKVRLEKPAETPVDENDEPVMAPDRAALGEMSKAAWMFATGYRAASTEDLVDGPSGPDTNPKA